MSEIRKPDETITHRLPGIDGKKQGKISIKYELFRAHQFASAWKPTDARFFPKPPLQSAARIEYWETMYRVKVRGKWLGPKNGYRLFTLPEIFDLIRIGVQR